MTATKTRTRSAKLMTLPNGRIVLTITMGKEHTAYLLLPLQADQGHAVRLSKANTHEEYDVLLDGNRSSCECLGFLRWHHCKHVESLTVLCQCGKLVLPVVYEPEPESNLDPFGREIDAMGETAESRQSRDEYEALHHSGIAPWM